MNEQIKKIDDKIQDYKSKIQKLVKDKLYFENKRILEVGRIAKECNILQIDNDTLKKEFSSLFEKYNNSLKE